MSRIARTQPFLILAVLALSLTGCSRTKEAIKKDTEENVTEAKAEAKKLGEQAQEGAEKLGEKAQEGAEKAAEATAGAMDEAGRKAAAGSRTLAVKTALMADKRVDASRIDVDSDGDANIVHLRGKVSTEAEKAMASEVAMTKADGWTISNELVVEAKAP